jgi:protein ImuB
MPVNAALALSPDLGTCFREAALERDVLSGLAAWAVRFTPAVSLDPCGALLLEVAGSAALFGGPAKLRAAAVAGARQRGHVVMSALAPTARAALWLASSGKEVVVTECARLPGVLAELPLRLPGWPDEAWQSLRRMGIRQLGECMRLPRDGLARRLGQSYLAEIDEALGRRPESRQMFRERDRFRGELDLPADTRESAFLMEALQILLARLQSHLRARRAGVRVLCVHLRHRTVPATLLRIGLLRLSTDAGHLGELVALRLSTLRLAAPVTSMMLEADTADMPPAAAGNLFGLKSGQAERVAGLLERLRMRLGPDAVHGIRACCEHRPERAWRAVPDPRERYPRRTDAFPGASRPLWLLDSPQTLHVRSGKPFFHGPVVFESGPERIETGWWDGGDVRRDYHVVRNPRGIRMWIFRDRRGGWYLHGLFG